MPRCPVFAHNPAATPLCYPAAAKAGHSGRRRAGWMSCATPRWSSRPTSRLELYFASDSHLRLDEAEHCVFPAPPLRNCSVSAMAPPNDASVSAPPQLNHAPRSAIKPLFRLHPPRPYYTAAAPKPPAASPPPLFRRRSATADHCSFARIRGLT